VVDEVHLEDVLAGVDDLVRVGLDLHAVARGVAQDSIRPPPCEDVDGAYAAEPQARSSGW
jgi:hypothetical protein